MEAAFLLNLAAGFFRGSQDGALVSELAVLDRGLMGSSLVISGPQSTIKPSSELL